MLCQLVTPCLLLNKCVLGYEVMLTTTTTMMMMMMMMIIIIIIDKCFEVAVQQL